MSRALSAMIPPTHTGCQRLGEARRSVLAPLGKEQGSEMQIDNTNCQSQILQGSMACARRSCLCLEQRCWDVPEARNQSLQGETSFRATRLPDFQPVLWCRSGRPVEEERVLWRNAVLRLFAQHPVCFPHRTMTSRKPVLSSFTKGYCTALIPPLIILKPVKL